MGRYNNQVEEPNSDEFMVENIDDDDVMVSEDEGNEEGEPIAETDEDYFDEIIEIED